QEGSARRTRRRRTRLCCALVPTARRGRGRGRLPGEPRALPRGRPLVRGLLADERRGGPDAPRRRRRPASRNARSDPMSLREAPPTRERDLARELKRAARPLAGTKEDFDPILDRVGEARVVLIGEASHGTHDFYRVRAEITKRLVLEKGFHAVAVEGDWPDCWRINRYVKARAGADS